MIQRIRILVIGSGGIGSLLTMHILRAISHSGLINIADCIEISLMDSDVVEPGNLPHQQFASDDLSHHKVTALQNHAGNILLTQNDSIELLGIAQDYSAETDISEYDLVVVAVDSEQPRNLVHSNAKNWLDLRASGDGFVMWSNHDDLRILDSLPKPPVGVSTSCQLDEAVESGNIQFGFALAAAHGAQWIVQWLRGADTPPGRIYTIHMGDLTPAKSY